MKNLKNFFSSIFLGVLAVSPLIAMKKSCDDDSSFARREHLVAKLTAARQAEEAKRQQPKEEAKTQEQKEAATAKLFAGIWYDRDDVVKKAIEEGADLNAQDETGYGALHFATLMQRPHVVPGLIEAGIDLNARINGWPSVIGPVMHHKPGEGLIIALKESGTDAEAVNNVTALHLAVSQESWFITYCLIRCGADINAKDSLGRTPQEWAQERGWLLSYSIIVTAASSGGAFNPKPKNLTDWIEQYNKAIPHGGNY